MTRFTYSHTWVQRVCVLISFSLSFLSTVADLISSELLADSGPLRR